MGRLYRRKRGSTDANAWSEQHGATDNFDTTTGENKTWTAIQGGRDSATSPYEIGMPVYNRETGELRLVNANEMSGLIKSGQWMTEAEKDEEAPRAARFAKDITDEAGLSRPDQKDAPLRAFGAGFTQGATLWDADEGRGRAQALKTQLGVGNDEFRGTPEQVYRDEREVERLPNNILSENNPWSYGAGEMVGGAGAAVAATTGLKWIAETANAPRLAVATARALRAAPEAAKQATKKTLEKFPWLAEKAGTLAKNTTAGAPLAAAAGYGAGSDGPVDDAYEAAAAVPVAGAAGTLVDGAVTGLADGARAAGKWGLEKVAKFNAYPEVKGAVDRFLGKPERVKAANLAQNTKKDLDKELPKLANDAEGHIASDLAAAKQNSDDLYTSYRSNAEKKSPIIKVQGSDSYYTANKAIRDLNKKGVGDKLPQLALGTFNEIAHGARDVSKSRVLTKHQNIDRLWNMRKSLDDLIDAGYAGMPDSDKLEALKAAKGVRAMIHDQLTVLANAPDATPSAMQLKKANDFYGQYMTNRDVIHEYSSSKLANPKLGGRSVETPDANVVASDASSNISESQLKANEDALKAMQQLSGRQSDLDSPVAAVRDNRAQHAAAQDVKDDWDLVGNRVGSSEARAGKLGMIAAGVGGMRQGTVRFYNLAQSKFPGKPKVAATVAMLADVQEKLIPFYAAKIANQHNVPVQDIYDLYMDMKKLKQEEARQTQIELESRAAQARLDATPTPAPTPSATPVPTAPEKSEPDAVPTEWDFIH